MYSTPGSVELFSHPHKIAVNVQTHNPNAHTSNTRSYSHPTMSNNGFSSDELKMLAKIEKKVNRSDDPSLPWHQYEEAVAAGAHAGDIMVRWADLGTFGPSSNPTQVLCEQLT